MHHHHIPNGIALMVITPLFLQLNEELYAKSSTASCVRKESWVKKMMI